MLPVPGHDMFNLYGKASEGFAKRDGERYARGDVKIPDPDMDAFLELHGIRLDPTSEVYRKAAYAFTRSASGPGMPLQPAIVATLSLPQQKRRRPLPVPMPSPIGKTH